MARLRRLETLQAIVETGLVPIFYQPEPEVAVEIARALARGGSRIVEFTSRGDGAFRVFERIVEVCRAELPEVAVGVGTISDPGTAALYLALGADFVVSPVLHPEVVRVCNRRKVPVVPGCGSATEIAAAEELGCEIVKVFPADALGGPGFIRTILGPSPWSSLVPTRGVALSRESVASWIEAGACALGMGPVLVSEDVVAARDYDTIAGRVERVLGWIRAARSARES